MLSMSNDVRLTLIGGPTLLIEWQGLRMLTDPTFDPAGSEYRRGPVVLRKTAAPAIEVDAIGRIDVVLLSHDQHDDNLDAAGRALLPSAGRVLTTVAGAGRLGGNAEGLKPWSSTTITSTDGRAIDVTATPARHGPPGIEPVSGDVIGFVLAAGPSSSSIYIAGDTVWYDGVAQVAQRFPSIRFAILHLGAARVAVRGPDHLTMNTADAVAAAQAFADATIVPVHYDGWEHFSEGQHDFERAFANAGLSSRVRWLKLGQPTTLP